MQRVQDPNQSNVDYLNTVRHETSRHFRNKKKKYLNAKIDELENNLLLRWHYSTGWALASFTIQLQDS
jgi:hypothetical protein